MRLMILLLIDGFLFVYYLLAEFLPFSLELMSKLIFHFNHFFNEFLFQYLCLVLIACFAVDLVFFREMMLDFWLFVEMYFLFLHLEQLEYYFFESVFILHLFDF